MGLECPAKDCPSWKSDNTTNPYAGHCIDNKVLACYRRSRVKGFPDLNLISEEEEDDRPE